MSLKSRSRSVKQKNPRVKTLVPRPYIHMIPQRGPAQFNEQVPKGGRGVGTVKARIKARNPFFAPLFLVYGYKTEEDYQKFHVDVVKQQKQKHVAA